MQQAGQLTPQQQQQQQQQLQQQQQQQQQLLQQQQQNGGDLAAYAASQAAGGRRGPISGGRFDFEDGGTYCGGWDEGKAHGHGVCTGPKHQGAYAGAWNYGFEVSGSYIWPSGSHYEGQWQNGRRHGLGVEQIGRQIYRGEWSKDGHKGRYGVRESTVSTAKYEGTWNEGYQDGSGCETYADGGKYQGQWQEGKRHGYGIRTSAPFGLASHHRRKNLHASLSSLRSGENGNAAKMVEKAEEIRGGFVLTAKSDKLPVRRNSLTDKTGKKGFLMGLKMRKQRSTGDLEKRGTIASGSIRSTMSSASWISTGSEQSNLTTKSNHTESNASFTMEDEQLDPTVVETYMGEWKKDKRCGHGVAERSDGLKYEGEWYNNRKHGYGVTTFRDGTVEEGKYKNNILITSQKKKHLFLARSRKFRDRITAAVNAAQRALKMAMQRSDMAISRMATAAAKAQNADAAAEQARMDCENAVRMAREFAPDFKPSVLERFEKLRFRERERMGHQQQHQPLQQQPSLHASPTHNASNLLRRASQMQQQQLQEAASAAAMAANAAAMAAAQQQQRSGRPPMLGQMGQQSSIDHFDHYKRPPSRDSSIDRYARAASRASGAFSGSRQTSLDRSGLADPLTNGGGSGGGTSTPDGRPRAGSVFRGSTPQPGAGTSTMTGNGSLPSGTAGGRLSRAGTPSLGSGSGGRAPSQGKAEPLFSSPNQPFEDVLLRQRTLGQDIIPSPSQPKRTESLYLPAKPATPVGMAMGGKGGGGGGGGGKKMKNSLPQDKSKEAQREMDWYPEEDEEDLMFSPALLARRASESWIVEPPVESVPINVTLQRKKSMPDFQELPRATEAMSREEVSALGSARREAVRRQIEVNERLKANPLLYLVSPQVKDWFVRQQLMLLVLIFNVALALLFVYMLT
ncbi:hypothetical protein M5D96_003315 [Drosophila gunungcola]|nr:hypothetical protein M5D96_003315 [Drosophila gunungcola]